MTSKRAFRPRKRPGLYSRTRSRLVTRNRIKGSDRQQKPWLTEGIIIAAITIMAYLLAFTYEVGYAKVFGIPLSFITVNLTTIFIVAGAMLLVILSLFLLSDAILIIFPESDHPLYRNLRALFPSLLLLVALIMLFGPLWKEWIWVVIVIVFITLLLLGLPLLTQRDKESYREKLEAQFEFDRQEKSLFDFVYPYVSPRLLLLLWIGISLCYFGGRAEALRQEEFLVRPGSQECVVLRVYGDNLICVPFDKETKEVERSFVIFKVGEDSKTMWKSEKVGPLHQKKQDEKAR